MGRVSCAASWEGKTGKEWSKYLAIASERLESYGFTD
jgi:hypothetical protein